MEYLLQRNTEDVRDSKGNFERWRVLITFNCVDGLTSNENTVGKFLLRHVAGTAQFTNCIADSRIHCLPTPSFLSFDKSSRHHMLGPLYCASRMSCGHPIGDELADDASRPCKHEQVEKNADEEVG